MYINCWHVVIMVNPDCIVGYLTFLKRVFREKYKSKRKTGTEPYILIELELAKLSEEISFQ